MFFNKKSEIIKKLLDDNNALQNRIKELEGLSLSGQGKFTFELLNNTSIAAVLIGINENILEVNKEYAKRFNKTREELINTNAYAAYPKEVAEGRRQAYARVAESGETYSFIDERDGLWNLHSMYPIKDDNGKVTSIAIYGLNITEQRKTELKLQKSEELFNTTVNSLSDIIHVVDKDFKIILANNSCIETNKSLGFTVNIIGKNLFDAIPYLDNKIKEEYKTVLNTGKTITVQEEFTFGTNKVYTATKRIPVLENGKVTRIITSINDITKIKQAENELHEALATKDKFMSIVAHDLINPITAVCNVAEILKTDYENLTPEKRVHFISTMHSSLIGTNHLLDNLLTWSRAQRRMIAFNPVEINVCELLKNSFDLLINTALGKEIKMTFEGDTSDVIFADLEMISTVLRNLISNAIKFSHRGGEIIVGHRKAKSGFAEIYIADKGSGMHKKTLDKLLKFGEDFTTLGTEKEKGTGLGLILCEEFLKLHNSKLIIKSEEGKGSKFSFLLSLGSNNK